MASLSWSSTHSQPPPDTQDIPSQRRSSSVDEDFEDEVPPTNQRTPPLSDISSDEKEQEDDESLDEVDEQNPQEDYYYPSSNPDSNRPGNEAFESDVDEEINQHLSASQDDHAVKDATEIVVVDDSTDA